MTTAIVFNKPAPGQPDSEDVLREVEFVESALAELGRLTCRIPAEAGLDGMAAIIQTMRETRSTSVFNLVESLGDNPRLHPAGAALFEIAGIPFTGSPYETLLLTTDKASCKAIMRAMDIPTPEWALYPGLPAQQIWDRVASGGVCIAKPLWEDASIGINDDSVFSNVSELESGLARMHQKHGRLLVEGFASGREFNVSVIESPDGRPRALPIAEMCFQDWPSGKPKIVNYSAKWDPESFEFDNTVRRFTDDPELAGPVEAAALKAWEAFGLQGYARVDIRLDSQGAPQVIEINANPCISPDSGFVAASQQAGMSPSTLVGGILDAALSRGGRK